ncbi:MAG: MFS transporter [Bacteroidaceae bacterium]|nr:MFS transporter [Bacteroidaceae bacterium]
MDELRKKINDSAVVRWIVLVIVATAMMMGYFLNDIMSPLETLLEMPVEEGGLGWTSTDYGFFSGSSGLINVFLLMLFFSGLILDKMGVRFTGVLACSLMLIGVGLKYYAVTAPLAGDTFNFNVLWWDVHLPMSAAVASLGFAIFGVGYEMCGITVSKAMVRWFTGHELALAMGIQLAMARLGTAAALSVSAPVARHFSLSTPLLLGLLCLLIGLVSFFVFCVLDIRLDKDEQKSIVNGQSSMFNGNDDQFHLRDIGLILKSPGFWLITLFVVLFYSAVSPFLKFATRLMIDKYAVAPDIAGFFTSIVPFGTILMTPLFGSVYDKYGRGVTLIIIGTGMLTLVHFGFSLPIHASAFAIFLMVLLSIGFSLTPAALWPIVPKIMPMKCLGTAYSLIFFIQNFGRAIIPMFVGKANETDPSYTSGMQIFACTGLAAVLVAISMLYLDKKMGYGLEKPNIVNG